MSRNRGDPKRASQEYAATAPLGSRKGSALQAAHSAALTAQ